MTRRKFLALAVKALAVTATSGSLLSLAAARCCIVDRRNIAVPGLPHAFDGFRIALMSDFHHSSWIPASYLRTVVAQANALAPDLVALTGDYIHRGREWVPGCMRELAGLRARHGVFGVLGNHDHYKNSAPAVREGLRRAGITDLTNRAASIRRGGEVLHLGGVGDYWREKQKLDLAIGASRTPGSVILLQHNPDYVERIRDDRIGLVLCGHTHGGQCVLPFLGPPILPSRYGQKYASGLCHGPVTQAYVTRGVGTSFPPIRFLCPAEISLLTLRSKKIS